MAQLADLITIINGELTKNDRKKLITLCTIDVHARDVVQRLIEERVENQSCFQWQSQLRYYQNEKSKEAQVNICDAEIKYTYEYIGNCGCLCITPLTDRCYITLTQAQRLVLGGAPAGPAGMSSSSYIALLYTVVSPPYGYATTQITATDMYHGLASAVHWCGNIGHHCYIVNADHSACPLLVYWSYCCLLQKWSYCFVLPSCDHTVFSQKRPYCLSCVVVAVISANTVQEPERLSPPRIWLVPWECSATCSTALTRWTTRPWARSTRVWRRLVPGVALMSSTAFQWQCFLSAPHSTRQVGDAAL